MSVILSKGEIYFLDTWLECGISEKWTPLTNFKMDCGTLKDKLDRAILWYKCFANVIALEGNFN